MTKSQKGAIEEHLNKLLRAADRYESKMDGCNNAKTIAQYEERLGKICAQFDTARYILNALGYYDRYCDEENKLVLCKLS